MEAAASATEPQQAVNLEQSENNEVNSPEAIKLQNSEDKLSSLQKFKMRQILGIIPEDKVFVEQSEEQAMNKVMQEH